MGKTIDAAEAARRLGIDPSRVRVLCRQRRIPGARLVGRTWMIPEDLQVTPGTRGPAMTASLRDIEAAAKRIPDEATREEALRKLAKLREAKAMHRKLVAAIGERRKRTK